MATNEGIQSVVDELVAANRILYRHGIVDAFGHVSARHPLNPDRFLIAVNIAPARVTAAHIIELDLAGNPSAGDDRPLFLERFIHAEIYRVRRDVGSVVHSHSASVIPFGVVPTAPLRPLTHSCGFLHPAAPVFEAS